MVENALMETWIIIFLQKIKKNLHFFLFDVRHFLRQIKSWELPSKREDFN